MLIDAPGVEEQKAGEVQMALTDENAGEVMNFLQALNNK